MGDYTSYKDSIGTPRGNSKRFRDKLVENSLNIKSETRYLTAEEIEYGHKNNLFIIEF